MAEEQPPVSDSSAVPDTPATADPSAPIEPVMAAAEAPSHVDEAASAPVTADTTSMMDQAAMDELLKQASFEDVTPSPHNDPGTPPPETAPFELPSFNQVMQDAQASSIELLRDVELNVKIELGRSRMLVEDVLKLAEGSVRGTG